MSGRRSDGDESGPGRSLGQKIGNEIRSALRLLFKGATVHAVSLELPTRLTFFNPAIITLTERVPLGTHAPAVSEDPVQQLHRLPTIKALNPAPTTKLAENGHGAASIAFDTRSQALSLVTESPRIENICPLQEATRVQALTQADLRMVEPDAQPKRVTELLIPRPGFKQFPADALQITLKSSTPRRQVDPGTFKTRSIADPRFLTLPLRKAPIPPHRFRMEVRAVFRKFLADSVGTHPDNVNLKYIFEQLEVRLFSGIQQDAQGFLLCTPRPDFTGKVLVRAIRTSTLPARQETAAPANAISYLVIGNRLDNNQLIRALVPLSSVPRPPAPEGLPPTPGEP